MDGSTDYSHSRGMTSQLFRYAFVGLMSNAAGYLVYLVFTHMGVTPKLMMSLTYGVGAAIGFFGNRGLTFSYKGTMIGSGLRYLMVYVLGYLMNLSLLVVFVDKLGYPHQLVQAMAILVVASFLFAALRFYVFRTTGADACNGRT